MDQSTGFAGYDASNIEISLLARRSVVTPDFFHPRFQFRFAT